MPAREENQTRDGYRRFMPLSTRWKDNDTFGHINNVVYYSYIDTAVTNFYFEHGYDVTDALVIPNIAENGCTYRRPIRHPADIEAGLRTEHIGNTSVRHGVGIFLRGEHEPCAYGFMVHVWIDRVTGRPSPIPTALREAMKQIEAV